MSSTLLNNMKFNLLLILIFSSFIISGQVVWTEPAFPTQLDDVTVFFDATEGNQGLNDFTGEVYAHTGVITNQSTSPTDWKNVQGVWGTDDPNTKMVSLGNNLYSLTYNITDYYKLQTGQTVEKLAFVFRNVDGSESGRASDGSDIYLDVFPPNQGLLLSLNNPTSEEVLFLGDSILISFNVNKEASITVENNDNTIFSGETDKYEEYLVPDQVGNNEITITVTDGSETIERKINYIVLGNNQHVENPPSGTQDGINYLENSYIFQIYAPRKDFSFFLCPANDFKVDVDYLMNKSIDGARYWIELPRSIFENQNNLFQYLIDGSLKIADPYSEIVLDPFNDQWVDEEILLEFPSYPSDLTDGIITVFDLEKTAYPWINTDFEKPSKESLVVYELLMRDFLEDHSYASLLDTLDYLEQLGINAIELMPVNEFEGNDSWGYNPSFHMALDKYYGSRDQLKRVIDEAHGRGIAVILDVVFNHCFSQSPLAQLYWDPVNFRPAEDNPWLNVTPRHPFNVGYDFNHESPLTKQWTKRVLSYWIEEFNFDGFRFDLSKGLTQTNSGNNSNLMAAYDQSRINIITDYADYIWDIEDDFYVILEHFSEQSEEAVYAERGMMLWANTTFQFSEAAMGYSSNLSGADYSKRGLAVPAVLAYMESHDEERMRHKVKEFGNSNLDYNTKDFNVSMHRILAASSIYYSIPGPKMIWQFGELGYEFPINWCVGGGTDDNCRLDPKPIRWDYFNQANRNYLYNRLSAIIHLKTTYPTFNTRDFEFSDQSYLKSVVLRHPEMDAVTIVNTNVEDETLSVDFPSTGTWYEYLTGEELNVTSTPFSMELDRGEYLIYTSNKIVPPGGFTTAIKDIEVAEINVYPNLIKDQTSIFANLEKSANIKEAQIISISGQITSIAYNQNGSNLEFQLPENLVSGTYRIRIVTDKGILNSYLVKI